MTLDNIISIPPHASVVLSLFFPLSLASVSTAATGKTGLDLGWRPIKGATNSIPHGWIRVALDFTCVAVSDFWGCAIKGKCLK